MDLVTQLALGRVAIGALALGRPAGSATLLGQPDTDDRPIVYLTRLAGVRDIALGVATLLAPRGARKALLGVGMAVDASDAYAGYEAFRSGLVGKPVGALLVLPAVAAVAAGAAGLREPAAQEA